MLQHSAAFQRIPVQTKTRLLALTCIVAAGCWAVDTRAHTWYEAQLTPLPGGQVTSEGAFLGGGFPHVPGSDPLPSCSSDPMFLSLDAPDLEGELTAIVWRLGDAEGTVHFRVTSDDETIRFDEEDCDVLLDWEFVDPEQRTPFFIVVESSVHPQGALGGRLTALQADPTIEWTWGRVKRAFVAAP